MAKFFLLSHMPSSKRSRALTLLFIHKRQLDNNERAEEVYYTAEIRPTLGLGRKIGEIRSLLPIMCLPRAYLTLLGLGRPFNQKLTKMA